MGAWPLRCPLPDGTSDSSRYIYAPAPDGWWRRCSTGRLIFHGGLSRDKQEAVKQVAAIIQRGVEPAVCVVDSSGIEVARSGNQQVTNRLPR